MNNILRKTVLTLTTFMSVNSAFANTEKSIADDKTVADKSAPKTEQTTNAELKSSEEKNQPKELKDEDIKWWAHDEENYHPVPNAGLSNNVFYCAMQSENNSAMNALANTLPPTQENKADARDGLANSLPPTPEMGFKADARDGLANSLPPTPETDFKADARDALANSLPPTPETDFKADARDALANSLPPTPENTLPPTFDYLVVAKQTIKFNLRDTQRVRMG